MINFNKYPVSLFIYLLILIGGLSLGGLLLLEYQHNQNSLQENINLTKKTVIKTLISRIRDDLEDTQIATQDIDAHWRELPEGISVGYNGRWLYPFHFSGTSAPDKSLLWKYYELDAATDMSLVESKDEYSLARQQALLDIKATLANDAQPDIKSAVSNYFLLVENHPLSPLEEVISGLRFIQLNDKLQWSQSLVSLYLLEGNAQFKSIVELLLRENSHFSKKDAQLAVNKIRLITETLNLHTNWLNNALDQLWKKEPAMSPDDIQDMMLVEGRYLSLKSKQQRILLVPFSLENALHDVTDALVRQELFEPGDKIESHMQKETSKVLLESIPINITRKQWGVQSDRQQQFFILKIILLVILIVSLLISSSYLIYRNRKRSELINLRENFINLVSHELKTPLTSIRLMAETLQKRSQRNMPLKDYPERIVNDIDRLWLMVENLLSLNYIKSEGRKLNFENMSIYALIEKLTPQFSEQLSRPFVVSNHLPKGAILDADAMLLELVFINLFSNAIKYCDKEQIDIVITLADNHKSNEGCIVLLFKDNGSGIAHNHWEKIFDEFFRETQKTAIKGSGIGLAVCRKIIALHRGDIKIIHSDKQGTKWQITLPKQAEQVN